MNDQDLERQLRSQRGPREEEYTPTRLPATLDVGPSGRRGPSPLLRAGMLVGVGVAAALAVAVVSGLLSGSSPQIGGMASATPSATPSASASPTSSPGDGSCDSTDLSVTAEPWGGAAGSRGTTVTIALASTVSACALFDGGTAQVADANGTVLVSGELAGTGERLQLERGQSYQIGIAWSNWCRSDPAAPVTLSLKLVGWASWVPLTAPAAGLNPVPPCLGVTPTSLGVTGLQELP